MGSVRLLARSPTLPLRCSLRTPFSKRQQSVAALLLLRTVCLLQPHAQGWEGRLTKARNQHGNPTEGPLLLLYFHAPPRLTSLAEVGLPSGARRAESLVRDGLPLESTMDPPRFSPVFVPHLRIERPIFQFSKIRKQIILRHLNRLPRHSGARFGHLFFLFLLFYPTFFPPLLFSFI